MAKISQSKRRCGSGNSANDRPILKLRMQSSSEGGRRTSYMVAGPRHTALPSVSVSHAMTQLTAGLVLDERLTNWANVVRGRRGDARDSALVDAAWHQLSKLEHRILLRMYFVWRAPREVICRRLKIKRRPWHIFEQELAEAKADIAEVLSINSKRR